MTLVMRKPILVAGLGLSAVFLGWEGLHHSLSGIEDWGLWAAIALGSGVWWLRPKKDKSESFKPVSPLTEENVQQAIQQAQQALNILQREAPDVDINPLQQQLNLLPSQLEASNVTVAIAGGKGTGKSTLKSLLDGQEWGEEVKIMDTDALFGEFNPIHLDTLQIADLILFLTNGDLTDTEWQALQYFHRHHQPVILLFNKQDRHIPEDRALIGQMLRQRVESLITADAVLSVSLNPMPITVRRYDSEGNKEEFLEAQPPELSGLKERLTAILEQDRPALVLGRVWRDAKQIQQQAKTQLNNLRREKALPIIETYQWIAGTTAVATPMATLDLIAAAAINGQMVMDLGKVYHQSFSVSQAQTVSRELAQLMLKLGMVELSTQAIGSVLKSHAMTYLAGGVIQGISAAYLTRVAGLSLVEYWQERELTTENGAKLNLERLSQTLKQVFSNNQRMDFLKGFVTQAIAQVSVS